MEKAEERMRWRIMLEKLYQLQEPEGARATALPRRPSPRSRGEEENRQDLFMPEVPAGMARG